MISVFGRFFQNYRVTILYGLAFIVLMFWLISTGFMNERFKGGIGLTIALVAGASLPLGIMLAYHTFVDWCNLNIVRRSETGDRTLPADGEVFAFSGKVRIEGKPLVSPITKKNCAVYVYSIAISRSGSAISGSSGSRRYSSRKVLAEGFHMIKTRIENENLSLGLFGLPSFESEMRENDSSDKWSRESKETINGLFGNVPSASKETAMNKLLKARDSTNDVYHQDFCHVIEPLLERDHFVIDEDVLAVDDTVCVVGTYNEKLGGLTPEKSRVGGNLMIYQGDHSQVLERVGSDVRLYIKVATWLVGIGAIFLILAMLPTKLTSTFPLIGSLIIV